MASQVCAVAQELLLNWLFYLVRFVQFAAGGPRFVLLCEGVCWEVGVLPEDLSDLYACFFGCLFMGCDELIMLFTQTFMRTGLLELNWLASQACAVAQDFLLSWFD